MPQRILLGLIFSASYCLVAAQSVYATPAFEGMSYTAFGPSGVLGTAGSNASLLKMSQMGATTVALNTWWFQTAYNSNSVAPNYSGNSEPASAIGAAIDYAHSLGMKVLFKPMLDISDGTWRAYITPTDTNTWWGYNSSDPYVNGSTVPLSGSYGDYIGQMADIAQTHHADMFSVGCEMNNMEQYTTNWDELISNVKTRYSGPLTYSANWSTAGTNPKNGLTVNGGYTNVQFWNQLNEVGIDAYFPLTNTNDPTETALQNAWTSRASSLGTWLSNLNTANSTNLRMLFTETGYSSYRGTNKAPATQFGSSSVLDTTEQANCYQALLTVMSQQSWWDGAMFWNWQTSASAGGTSNKDFTPQNKPAQQVASQFYLLRGDFDLNHKIDNGDLQAMLSVLQNESSFESTYFFNAADLSALGDFNGDGVLDAADIQGELNLIVGASGGGGQTSTVPEPASVVLLGLAVLMCPAISRRRYRA